MKKLDKFIYESTIPDCEKDYYFDVLKSLQKAEKEELISLFKKSNKEHRVLQTGRLNQELQSLKIRNIITIGDLSLLEHTIGLLPKYPHLAKHMQQFFQSRSII
ncbi:hypothetical protein [Virgibacillus sp. JSM 102003]|uniref:hypothetical protein n=1 Tax=Virgibacillus sp. JSM 102003 TaxID=1562108 RepID=UPI0035BFD968